MFGLIPFKTNKNGVQSEGGYNNFLSDFFNDDFFGSIMSQNNFSADIRETDNAYLLQADMPGVNKEDISLDYKNNNLIISAKRNNEVSENQANFLRRERSYGEFSRSFYLDNVDENNIRAKFTNGELQVILPKKEQYNDSSSKIQIE